MRVEVLMLYLGGTVPLHHNHPTAAALYAALDDPGLHDRDGIKPFGFWPIYQVKGKPRPVPGGFQYEGEARLVIGCQTMEMLEAVLRRLRPGHAFQIGEAKFRIQSVLPCPSPQLEEVCLWAPVSYICSARWDPEARVKTHPCPKLEYETVRGCLLHNLSKKIARYAPSEGGAEVALEINTASVRETVLFIGKSSLRAWKGEVLVAATQKVQEIIWNLGLGANNAMGLGGVRLLQTGPVPASA